MIGIKIIIVILAYSLIKQTFENRLQDQSNSRSRPSSSYNSRVQVHVLDRIKILRSHHGYKRIDDEQLHHLYLILPSIAPVMPDLCLLKAVSITLDHHGDTWLRNQ